LVICFGQAIDSINHKKHVPTVLCCIANGMSN
jgi:hypothetical protein